MKYTLLFGFILTLNLCFSQQLISGSVVDAESNQPLAYASIIIKKTNIGVLSDEDGNFELIIPEQHKTDSLVINFIGYQSQSLAIKDNPSKIELTNQGNTIEQIVVTPIDADSIMKVASERYVENHIRNLNKQDGFIRTTIKSEDDIFQIAESTYEVYYKKNEDEAERVLKRNESRMVVDSAIYREMNEVFNRKKDTFLFEPTSFLGINQAFDSQSDDDDSKLESVYEYLGKTNYQGREVYEITADTYRKKTNLVKTTVLIDIETFAFASIEYETVNESQINKLIPLSVRLVLGLLGYKVDFNKISGRVYYRYNGEFFELDKGVFYMSVGVAKGGEWIRGSIFQEYYLQESKAIKSIPEFKKDYTFKSETVTEFEPNYFNRFHLLTSSKTKEKIAEINEKNKQFSGEIYSERHKKWLKKQEKKKN